MAVAMVLPFLVDYDSLARTTWRRAGCDGLQAPSLPGDGCRMRHRATPLVRPPRKQSLLRRLPTVKGHCGRARNDLRSCRIVTLGTLATTQRSSF